MAVQVHRVRLAATADAGTYWYGQSRRCVSCSGRGRRGEGLLGRRLDGTPHPACGDERGGQQGDGVEAVHCADLRDRAQAVVLAYETGLVTPGSAFSGPARA
ncbi:hypothetical protein [Dactylosporangium sp. CA-233914]|uniref:hypothetical protein n=1 Tax=Dactylosporangium sp. CA-233914 TaxID=3239934 RepID=UPI003D92E313